MKKRRFLEEFGVRIAENGYAVIPIVPGEKRPYAVKNGKWQFYDGSPEGVEDWIKTGKGDHGVGIKTKENPAVDVDCHDPKIVNKVVEFVTELCGETIMRIGFAPKTLLLYQPAEEFPKIDSGIWLDHRGNNTKVEILSDGQQFVAAHIHPDTGKPYTWVDGKSVLNTKRTDLPVITKEQGEAIKAFAIQTFMEAGYSKKTNAVQRMSASGYDPDDPFAAVRAKTDISDDKLFTKLMLVPGAEDYDMWFHVGMALYHQYEGTQMGLDLWHQWSANAENYDAEACDKKWPTFNIVQKDRPPITARFILARAKEQEVTISKEALDDVLTGIIKSTDLEMLRDVCDRIKTIQFDMVVREMLVGRVKEKFKRLTGNLPRISVVRDMIRYESVEVRNMPGWLKNWCYIQHDTTFFNTVDRRQINYAAFEASHARLMMTPDDRNEGRAAPETSAALAALNLYQIPVVFNRMFMPGLEPLYRLNGIAYVNSYTDHDIPELPDELSPADQQAISIFLGHMDHLIPNAQDRQVFLDFLTFVIQNPGQRVNWMILLQGAEGDGKSFFAQMLRAVIGVSNVNGISGKRLEEKYNPWAENAMVCFVEDVRLHGANRFDAINTLRPMLTNTMVEIRRMQTNVYEVINTVSYIATSNSKDALPVADNDSRVYPIFSRFQRSETIDAFKRDNPQYYTRLHSVLNFGGALRKFFLEREISPTFNARDRAPKSSSRREMVALNRTPEDQALLDLLEDQSDIAFCDVLLDSSLIYDKFMDSDGHAPQGKALSRLLSEHGFTYLGRWRPIGEPNKHQYWTRRPDIWSGDEDILGEQVRDYLDPNGL